MWMDSCWVYPLLSCFLKSTQHWWGLFILLSVTIVHSFSLLIIFHYLNSHHLSICWTLGWFPVLTIITMLLQVFLHVSPIHWFLSGTKNWNCWGKGFTYLYIYMDNVTPFPQSGPTNLHSPPQHSLKFPMTLDLHQHLELSYFLPIWRVGGPRNFTLVISLLLCFKALHNHRQPGDSWRQTLLFLVSLWPSRWP